MVPSPLRLALARLAALPLLLLAVDCSSPPSRLYVLNSQISPSPGPVAAQYGAGYGPSLPVRAGGAAGGALLGVAVTVPEYLERSSIVERTGDNEVKPRYEAQWGEGLTTDATRVVAENLTALLPSSDVVMLPSRSRRALDYEINLDLTRFDSDPVGNSVVAGRWSISDRGGNELTSGRVSRKEQADQAGFDAMAAAMSRNLAAVSADIAAAFGRLPAAGATASPARGKRSPTQALPVKGQKQ